MRCQSRDNGPSGRRSLKTDPVEGHDRRGQGLAHLVAMVGLPERVAMFDPGPCPGYRPTDL
jgi:hypothetical protein